MNPRKPTEEEKQQLITYFQENGLIYEPETIETFDTWYIAVFDDYQFDYPGYHDKVLVILPTHYIYPEIVEIYVWHEGKITRVMNEEDINRIIDENLDKKHGTMKK
jgi:hypothetical protein